MCNQVDDLKSSLAKCIFKEKNKILTHILPNQQLNFKADRIQIKRSCNSRQTKCNVTLLCLRKAQTSKLF
ncbi:hypothetical protein T02_2188 [Trichinella nativa]|uniref:Uncharacterized protein n=1 Tax=Trichinella nativa TaxID=6335 RepID=A0A0V1LDQ6_9BILA|nr:hypothetical protein T02_2188 [Trichinella nativa]